jgi:hypothetical protein
MKLQAPRHKLQAACNGYLVLEAWRLKLGLEA